MKITIGPGEEFEVVAVAGTLDITPDAGEGQSALIAVTPFPPGGGGGLPPLQVLRNGQFDGEGNWRRGETPIVYEWEPIHPDAPWATEGNTNGKPPNAETDPKGHSLRFKAQEHTPPALSDGPIPYGTGAGRIQRIAIPPGYVRAVWRAKVVSHFDDLEGTGFEFEVTGFAGADVAGVLDEQRTIPYDQGPDPRITPWQSWQREFLLPSGITAVDVSIWMMMPLDGETGLKIAEASLTLYSA